jgi:uncharacterized protein (TIGR03437 family)
VQNVRFACPILFLLISSPAWTAAWERVPGPSTVPAVAGIERNRGQARPEALFLARGAGTLAVGGNTIFIGPYGVTQEFAGGTSTPQVSFLDALPGAVNYYSGADASKWMTGMTRYGRARLAAVRPGVDLEYRVGADGGLRMRLWFAAGADPAAAAFELAQAHAMEFTPAGLLVARLGPDIRLSPRLIYEPPSAAQGGRELRAAYAPRGEKRFGFDAAGWDPTREGWIEFRVPGGGSSSEARTVTAVDAEGHLHAAAEVPAPETACGSSLATPVACQDVAVYKFSRGGELLFATYLAGRTRERASSLLLDTDGSLLVSGTTDSGDFPVTAGVLQREYAGPPAVTTGSSDNSVAGDYFVARIGGESGTLRASTYLGGPEADSIGETALGPDHSVYLVHKWLQRHTAKMPTTRGSLIAECAGTPCTNSYAARLSPELDRLIFGSYLPGRAGATAKVHTDGSVYFAGSDEAGFPVTPGVLQSAPAGGTDGFIARLDPAGTRLIFGTYFGTAKQDTILRMAVGRDGGVWAHVGSFITCCVEIGYKLVKLDSAGARVLVEIETDLGDMAIDGAGNLAITSAGAWRASEDAFLASACGSWNIAYVKLSPDGRQLFATYLPASTHYDFTGIDPAGRPVLAIGNERYVVAEDRSMGVFTGCLMDAAGFTTNDATSPGAIVTLFGSKLGPREGEEFRLVDGRLPLELAGTRVLVNGEPVPLLYVSYWQVNLVLSREGAGNEMGGFRVQAAGISIFQREFTPLRPAAALNEDGTLNSPANPARAGSRVVLFGTGGGATMPPGTAGEVTPIELRPLVNGVETAIAPGTAGVVEFAGAAPGLLTGLIQINVKLPDTLPEVPGYPKGALPLRVTSRADTFSPAAVTVSVRE